MRGEGEVTWFPKLVEYFNIRFYGKRTLIRKKITQQQTLAWFCFVTSASRRRFMKCNDLESKDEKYHMLLYSTLCYIGST